MNPIDFHLERLFRSAARAPQPFSSEAPFALETRVLAAWRRGLCPERRAILPLVRRGCLCACAIIVIATAFTVYSLTQEQPPPSELVIVDSVIQLTLMQ